MKSKLEFRRRHKKLDYKLKINSLLVVCSVITVNYVAYLIYLSGGLV